MKATNYCTGLAAALLLVVAPSGYGQEDHNLMYVKSMEGKMSTFGGPNDTGTKPTEGLALVFPSNFHHYRDLFLPGYTPSGQSALIRQLNPNKFYIACRWNYNETPRPLLTYAQAKVINPRTGNAVYARPVDWGPNAATGRVADLSPGLAQALGLRTDNPVNVELYVPRILKVTVTWNTNTDVDLWVIEPGGGKCYYSNRQTAKGGELKADITSGRGPEEYHMWKGTPGQYAIKVHFFSGPRTPNTPPTQVRVEVVQNAYSSIQAQQTRTVTLVKRGEIADVMNVTIPVTIP